jgi:hypothetical protein
MQIVLNYCEVYIYERTKSMGIMAVSSIIIDDENASKHTLMHQVQ